MIEAMLFGFGVAVLATFIGIGMAEIDALIGKPVSLVVVVILIGMCISFLYYKTKKKD